MDLDRFREINAAFGHACGDVLLQRTARLQGNLRESDMVARLGGDEFGRPAPAGDHGHGRHVGRGQVAHG
jgi:GGDEF domain-containing protein